jgi:hypothetical protein
MKTSGNLYRRVARAASDKGNGFGCRVEAQPPPKSVQHRQLSSGDEALQLFRVPPARRPQRGEGGHPRGRRQAAGPRDRPQSTYVTQEGCAAGGLCSISRSNWEQEVLSHEQIIYAAHGRQRRRIAEVNTCGYKFHLSGPSTFADACQCDRLQIHNDLELGRRFCAFE